VEKRLGNFKRNVHSQNGEDGVIREDLSRLDITVNRDFWCVEFGAWDGLHLSNTFALVESDSVSAVKIEGDTEKFRDLLDTAGRFPSVIPVEGFVTGDRQTGESLVTGAFTVSYDPNKVGTLDDLLSATPCPRDYQLLSIDIDSHDLEVWEAHQDFSPKIVVLEINSSLAPGILQKHGHGNQGRSFSSRLSVGRSKGYTLACQTGNMIFVRNDLAPSLGLSEADMDFPERLFDPTWLPNRPDRGKQARALLKKSTPGSNGR
jgi:hypothetical protein